MRHITHILLTVAVALCGTAARSAPCMLPKATAAHFCRLLVCDGEGNISPISSYIRSHQTSPSDSLTQEQMFTTYVFNYDGWKTLRIFPHNAAGTVSWYASADTLPASMEAEHRKYIREVFLHLLPEIEAANWQTVDAYIDRMLQYQTTFGAPQHPSTPSLWPAVAIIAILTLLLLTAFAKSSSSRLMS